MKYTAKNKRQAVERELSYRRRVYARRVTEGKMTQALADSQVAVFESIRDDYAALELLSEPHLQLKEADR